MPKTTKKAASVAAPTQETQMENNFGGGDTSLTNALIGVGIQMLPNVIEQFKEMFKAGHPNAPQPTDEDVLASFEEAFKSSRDKDERWLAAHPE